MTKCRVIIMCCLLSATAAADDERFTFVVPGDDAMATATDMSALSPRPAGADGFVRVKDGHFHTDAGRLKIWGVNTCFGANFPTHEDAEKVAAHLAKLGINGLRMHHHDRGGRGLSGVLGETVDGYRRINPEALERQDYFLDQLHRRGIYANLNLHVARTFGPADGFDTAGMPSDCRYSKYVLYFDPRMRKIFKEFCREYLTHTNPYRKLRRVDDPGIAMIEITNENKFAVKGPGIAARMPQPYRGHFKRQWNAWLKNRYRTTAALAAAWKDTPQPLGDDIAGMGDFATKLPPWTITHRDDFPVKAIPNQPGPRPDVKALKLDIITPCGASWWQELHLENLSLKKAARYTLSFWVKADKPRSFILGVSNQGPDDWRSLGVAEPIEATAQWQQIKRVFVATETVAGNARICLKLGASDVDLYLADVHLRSGAEMIGLPAGQSIELANVEIPSTQWSETATRDIEQFMIDTEKDFAADMIAFLKNDLGVKVPITCSQITHHGPGVVSATCDYADVHGYWQHPGFPGRSWDRRNWLIPNTPMVCEPGQDTPSLRAQWRLLDRPFTISEWNMPDPCDFGAGVAPFVAMTAALQDWDGIFFFDYETSGRLWTSDRIGSFFSLNGQPVKLAMVTACANMFRRGDLKPLPTAAAGTIEQHVSPTLALTHRIGIDPKAKQPAVIEPVTGKRLASPDGAVVWDATDRAKAYVTVNTPATRAVWGLVAGQSFDLGDWKITVGKTFRDYAAIVVTSLDGKPLEQSNRILLTAVGSAQNRDMVWNDSRTSVGDQWGTGPTQVNGIPLTATFRSEGVRKAYALDGRGTRVKEIGLASREAGVWTLHVGPEHKTLWYELTP